MVVIDHDTTPASVTMSRSRRFFDFAIRADEQFVTFLQEQFPQRPPSPWNVARICLLAVNQHQKSHRDHDAEDQQSPNPCSCFRYNCSSKLSVSLLDLIKSKGYLHGRMKRYSTKMPREREEKKKNKKLLVLALALGFGFKLK